jgi:hypothetical protein
MQGQASIYSKWKVKRTGSQNMIISSHVLGVVKVTIENFLLVEVHRGVGSWIICLHGAAPLSLLNYVAAYLDRGEREVN